MSAAACKAILNSGNSGRILINLANEIQRTGMTPSEKVIALLNEAEDCANKATRQFLDEVGYDGALPHSLSFD